MISVAIALIYLAGFSALCIIAYVVGRIGRALGLV